MNAAHKHFYFDRYVRRSTNNFHQSNVSMKFLLIILALMTVLTSCDRRENTASAKCTEIDRVEIIYFHGKQRCATCTAIENNTAEVVNTLFSKELKDGSVVFKTIDISTPDGEKLADKYEVTWSSLFVNSWNNGEETRHNMTKFGFSNARNNPDEFKKGLADKIRQSMK